MATFLTADNVKTVAVGGSALTIHQKIIPATYLAPKYVASYVQQGQPMKPCKPLAGTGKPKGVTVHNTPMITVASGTNAAEQYARSTWNGNMGGVIVHFYVWRSHIWQLLEETEQGWHAADGATRRGSQRTGETIGGNLDTIAIECVGEDAESEATTAKLVAYLLRQHGLLPDTDVYTHKYFYPTKHCPAYLLPHWTDFLAQVATAYNGSGGDGLWRVQVGAWKTWEYALAGYMALRELGYDVYMVLADDLFKVQVGAFRVKDNAVRLGAELEGRDFEVYITTRAGVAVGMGQRARKSPGLLWTGAFFVETRPLEMSLQCNCRNLLNKHIFMPIQLIIGVIW